MRFDTVHQALTTLENLTVSREGRNEAYRYLTGLDGQKVTSDLIYELQSHDFGIRWEAANMLCHFGMAALPGMLDALTDPRLAGDSRVREGIYHAFRYNDDPHLRAVTFSLLLALKGPAADIESMRQAHILKMKLLIK